VLSNRIYQELSTAVAGSQEYMAMEKVYELHEQGLYDLLVLDTPPTRNALDFLDAPERLHRFIDSQTLRVLLHPTRTGLRLVSRGTGVAFSVLQRVTGVDVLRDVSEFFQSFGDMSEGFRRRAARVTELLEGPATTFVLVTSPGADAIDEAVFFHERLLARGMRCGAAIVNRMHELPPEDPPPVAGLVPDALARKVERNFADYRVLAERDWANVRRLAERIGDEPLILLPELDDDVHDLDGLRLIEQHLVA
jgi:anion-transporting  ArsA/GET3 family ATPase